MPHFIKDDSIENTSNNTRITRAEKNKPVLVYIMLYMRFKNPDIVQTSN